MAQAQAPGKASRALLQPKGGAGDICVPRVFHKPSQLLSIVSGEDGLLSLYHPITFPGNNSCPGGKLVPHEGVEMMHLSKKVNSGLKENGA